MWATELLHNSTGTRMKEFFPRPADVICLKKSYIHHELTEVLIWHCRLNHHLKKSRKSHLLYMNEGEKVEYFFFHCIRFTEQRASSLTHISETKIPFHLHLMSSQRTEIYGMHSMANPFFLNLKHSPRTTLNCLIPIPLG